MLSTGRLLRATKLLCDIKLIEGTNKCSFHVYAIKNTIRPRNDVLRRKQSPIAFGVVHFASTDASVDSAGSAASQVLNDFVDNADLKLLSELGIIPPLKTSQLENSTITNTENFPDLAPEFTQEDLIIAELPAENAEALMEPVLEASAVPEVELLMDSSQVLVEPMEPSVVQQVLPHSDLESPVLSELNASQSEGFEPVIEGNISEAFAEQIILPSIPINQAALEVNEDSMASAKIEVTASAPTPEIISSTGGIPELLGTSPDVVSAVAANVGKFAGEASLQSVGLGGWSPVGMVQHSLDFFHVSLDLPWWGAIALGTLIIRLAVFPLVIMSQRNAAKMNNNLPEMQAIQLKMSDARERGDKLDAARYAQELMEFMKVKGLNPIKNMIVPLCQAPFFLSMFMGIRGMANLPIESFHQGGLWWFVDLTLPDQYYLLPLITSATLALTVEVGTDMGKLNSSNLGMAKYLLRAMPLIIFPFTLNFPAGVLVYWCSTNFISLVQVAILRIPTVRDYFKIERLIKFDKKALPIKEKGFVGGVKDSWTNIKITKELEERERLDKSNFLRAGRGAIRKTYKFDPTQPQPPRNLSSIQLKKRD